MPSSRGLPSLATVAERFLLMCGKNRDCRKLDFSDLGVDVPSLLSFCLSLLSLLPRLGMRKKFLIFCETWLLEPLTCLFDRATPLKVRFSDGMLEEVDEELKSCVIAGNQNPVGLQGIRRWPQGAIQYKAESRARVFQLDGGGVVSQTLMAG